MKQTLADALALRGYETLTPVQQAVTDPTLEGADLLVSAQTGSGKTVGFGLALGGTLLGDGDAFVAAGAPLALIIAPTRELAMQVKRELGWLYAKAGVVMASCVGGMDMRDERRTLDRGAHIVVATPGRLRDHIMRGAIDLSAIRGVVLDEADEMLDLGFREDLEYILGECPQDRRTLMFSATVPKSIAGLAQKYQRDAQRITTLSGTSQHADIEYRAMTVANHDAEGAIINALRYFEAPNAIVFCNTRAMVGRITSRLSNRGFSVVALSGELTQSERSHALQAMRDGRARVCVATDVAARGIDLPNLDLVVHAELPSNHETLLHRSGRTGRAGRKGVSALVVTPKVRSKAMRILKSAKLEAQWGDAPSAAEVRAQDEIRLMSDPMWSEPMAESEADAVAKLTAAFTPEQLATATLRVLAQRFTAPEHLSPSGAGEAPKPRAKFGPSVWFSATGGRNQGVEVRRLLPVLCNAGGLTKDDIGAIRISDDTSYVEILQSSADAFTKAIGADMTVEGGVVLTQLDAPPAEANRPKPRFEGKPSRGPKPGGPARSAPRKGPRPDRGPSTEGHALPAAPAPEKVARKSEAPKYSETPLFADTPTPPAAAPRPAAPKGKGGAPIDWNDTSTPRRRKPKPGAAPAGNGKTGAGPAKKKPRTAMDAARADGAVTAPKGKPRHKDAGKPKGRGPANAAPPKGKPSSKKNRARAAAAQQGGSQPPRKPR